MKIISLVMGNSSLARSHHCICVFSLSRSKGTQLWPVGLDWGSLKGLGIQTFRMTDSLDGSVSRSCKDRNERKGD